MLNEKPNIVVITCHDLGDYLGCYGLPIHTPHLDQVATEGVQLDNHFAAASVCSPARGSLWTGCYPHTHGLMGLVPRGWELDISRCPPLPLLLHEVGYQNHLFGLQHEHWNPAKLGYDVVHDVKSHYCDHVASVFGEWITSRDTTDRKPFLANVGFFDPHRIGIASQGYNPALLNQLPSHFWRDEYTRVDPYSVTIPPYLLDTPEQRDEMADFYAAIQYVDSMIGTITNALDEAGLANNTLLMFVTDHGASFLHAKGTLYDAGTKVACLMRLPGTIPAGVKIGTLTSHVDIVPTVLELLGLPTPSHVEGESFFDLLRGQAQTHREYVFAEKNYTQYFDPTRMVRSNQFKYIRRGISSSIFDFVLTEIELSPSSFRNNPALFQFYSCKRRLEELYDLQSDPEELNNLAEDPKNYTVLAHMRATLDQHLETTQDPFRKLQIDLQMPPNVYANVKGLTS